jgi:hypothetical protein
VRGKKGKREKGKKGGGKEGGGKGYKYQNRKIRRVFLF